MANHELDSTRFSERLSVFPDGKLNVIRYNTFTIPIYCAGSGVVKLRMSRVKEAGSRFSLRPLLILPLSYCVDSATQQGLRSGP